MSQPTLELDIDAAWSQALDWEAVATLAAGAAAGVAPELAHEDMLVSLVFATDAEVHELNRQWRAKDAPTNVLSFPMLSREEVLRGARLAGEPVMLGDVILAYETCAREAAEKSIALTDHVTHLIVHGLLHLAGHDHQRDNEAGAMEALEREALAGLDIADPYDPTDGTTH